MFGIPFLTKETAWLAEIAIALVSLAIGLVVLRFVLRFLHKKGQQGKHEWAKQLERVVFRPARLLIWILGVAYILVLITDRFGITKILSKVYPIRNAFLVFVVSWFLLLWKKEMLHYLTVKSSKKKLSWDRHSIEFLGKVGTLFIVFIAVLLILQVLGLNIMPLVAFGGIGAAAIGFAAKDMIANFFGGLMIYVTRPYSLGDFVELPNQKVFGQIEAIGWYMTRIRNLDKVPVYIPNALFSTALIMNSTRRTHRKLQETISLRYKDFSKIQPILEQVRGYLGSSEMVDSTQPIMVYFSALGHYSLDIFMRAYIDVKSYQEFLSVKEEILMEIKKIVLENDAQVPFPTTTIEMERD